jgi:hypothetical protein
MAQPLVFFENIFEDGTLTTSTAVSGFPGSNITGWRPGTPYRWKVASGTASGQWVKVDLGASATAQPNTVAIGGHNFHTHPNSVTIEYSDDNAAWSSTATSGSLALSPTTGLPMLRTFTVAAAHRYWRAILRTSGSVPFANDVAVGIITLGRRLDFEKGLAPTFDAYGDEVVVEDSANENGSPLGVNLRYRRKVFSLSLNDAGMTKSGFYRPASGLSWDVDFRRHALGLPPDGAANPFWFGWNITEDPEEIYLCKVRRASTPFIGSTLRRQLMADFEGWREVA